MEFWFGFEWLIVGFKFIIGFVADHPVGTIIVVVLSLISIYVDW